MDGQVLIDRLRGAGATVSPSLSFFAQLHTPNMTTQTDHRDVAAEAGGGGGSEDVRRGERGVIARRNIQRGEVLLSLPPGCYIPPPLQAESNSGTLPPSLSMLSRVNVVLSQLRPRLS